jgi:glycosyltransferase involved in cell wall biosynthesis
MMGTASPRGTVIIAAHNEASVIARCLDSLAAAVEAGAVRVVVVCNGCTDATAQSARSRRGVVVSELPVASKAAALRAGDRLAAPGPRIYLDADVVLTSAAAIAVIEALGTGRALAGRPPVRFDTSGGSRLVRAWYTVRVLLPSIRRALWGAGTYALSTAGRARFDEFPDIVSDDLFIDSLFTGSETVIVDTDPVIVHAPRTASDLLRILVRTYRTQDDVLPRSGAGPVSPGQRGQLRDLASLIRRRPWLIVPSVVYVALILLARARARVGPAVVAWERDNSSREATPPRQR